MEHAWRLELVNRNGENVAGLQGAGVYVVYFANVVDGCADILVFRAICGSDSPKRVTIGNFDLDVSLGFAGFCNVGTNQRTDENCKSKKNYC